MEHEPNQHCWCNPTPTPCKEGIVWVHHDPKTTFAGCDYSDFSPDKQAANEEAERLLGGKIA